MTDKRAYEIIDEIISSGPCESGVFITLLCREYCKKCEMKKLTFISILTKTLTEEED